MSWVYEQKTGLLRRDDAIDIVGKGYSGHTQGKNNPALEAVPDVGPIPRGTYTIGPPYDSEHTGPYTLSLTPAPSNQMYGRSELKMHGDSKDHPGEASHGCVIMPHDVRARVWNSGDHQIEVVSGDNNGANPA